MGSRVSKYGNVPGRPEENALMPKRRNLASIAGVGGVSRSLGANDPRLRRNSSAIGASDVATGGAIRVDKKQRLVNNRADSVGAFEAPETNEEIKINDVINALKGAGLMDR